MPFAKISDIIIKKLRRITSSSSFIPEIDGLRFLAILMVVLVHANTRIIAQSQFIFSREPSSYSLIYNFINNGSRGVELFFVISGFVLALPFARHFMNKEKPVDIKKYFLRRITRIEPPYIVNIFVIFFYLIFKGVYTFTQLWPGLVSSFFYLNRNLNLWLPINTVAWSLEIEVQFYILAPLLCYLFVFKKIPRRIIILLLVVLLPIIHSFHVLSVLATHQTVYTFLQYFLLGFILVDLYISNFKIILPKFLSIIVGITAFLIIVYIDKIRPLGEIIFLLSIFVFYFLAMNDVLWKKFFSIKYLTTIGGMCYSIYLWHNFIMEPIIHRTAFIHISNNYIVALLLQSIIVLPCVLLFSTALYLLIERPCMNKNWPKDLLFFIKNKLKILKNGE